MKKLKHIGYFNDEEDINELNQNNPDEIVKYWKDGYGAFFHTDNEELSNFSEMDYKQSSLTSDGKYFVTFAFEEKGVTITDNEDCFIDIYEIIDDDDEYDADFCDDFCNVCDSEVQLPRKLSVYRCPVCGRWMPNCSMCYLMDEGKCPEICPLSFEAERRNKLEGWKI